MKVTWGILGFANITKKIIPTIQDSENGKLLAISSRSREKAKFCAQEYKIPKYYDTYQELLLDPEITAVYIPLPNHIHKKWALEAAKQHKHILCEKPFALTSQEAVEIFSSCKNEGVQIMEAFMYRFDPKIDKIKNLLKDNTVGEIKYMDFNFSHMLEEEFTKTNNYRLKQEAGGGALYDLGVYGINLCNYLLNAYPEEVMSSTMTRKDHNDVDRSIYFQLKYKENIIVTITASFQFFSNYLNIAGTTGAIEVSNIISQDAGQIRIKKIASNSVLQETTQANDSYKTMIQHFNECIIQNKVPMINEEQTLETLKVVETILRKKI